MANNYIFSKLEIPQTIAAGPGPGNTDERVLAAFSNAGLADHMHSDVLRGMIECKQMLRQVWGTDNIHTFGVAGTGWSGLDLSLRLGGCRQKQALTPQFQIWCESALPWVEVEASVSLPKQT